MKKIKTFSALLLMTGILNLPLKGSVEADRRDRLQPARIQEAHRTPLNQPARLQDAHGRTISAQGDECPDIPNKGTGGTWAQDARVTVNIDPRFRAINPDLTAAITRAFNSWGAASSWCCDRNQSGVIFTFTETAPPSLQDLAAGRVQTNTYHVIVGLAPGTDPTNHAGTGPLRGDPVRTYAYTFVNLDLVNTPADMFQVMLHEIGHTFSLSDCDDCPAGTTIMRRPHGLDGPTSCDNAVIKQAGQYQRQQPLVGDHRTYRVVGTSSRFTTVTERVGELVAGRVVYRVHVVGDPPGLGEYIGCDARYGEVEVATDVWDEDDPRQNDRVAFDPPIFQCPYGSPVKQACEWVASDQSERQVTEVLAYEPVTVPYGSFQRVMKVIVTLFDEDGEVEDEPLFFWIDRSIGIVRAEEVESGGAIELIAYTPPADNTQARPGGIGSRLDRPSGCWAARNGDAKRR